MSDAAKPVNEHTKEAEQYLRAAADLDNTRKRLQREHQERSRYAAEAVLRELLPIVDSLGQALIAVDKQSDLSAPPQNFGGAQAGPQAPATGLTNAPGQAVVKGVHLIYRQLLGLLEKEGVARIPTVGERFDPHRHEAVAQVDTDDHTADGTIMEEVQAGYMIHDKVLRPAMVKVAKAKSPQSPPQRMADPPSKLADTVDSPQTNK